MEKLSREFNHKKSIQFNTIRKKQDNNNNNNNNIEKNNYKYTENQEKVNGLEVTIDQDDRKNLNNCKVLLNHLNNQKIQNDKTKSRKYLQEEKEEEEKEEADITNNNQKKVKHPVDLEEGANFEPIDWKPNDKCNFCIDGKLLIVNANGELVAETGPHLLESDHVIKNYDSDSNSTDSKNLIGNKILLANHKEISLNKLLKLKKKNMTSMDSMVAHTISATLPEIYTNVDWLLALQQQQQDHHHLHQQQHQHQQQQQDQQEQLADMQPNSVTPTTSETSTAAISPALKDAPSPSYTTGEQPLDLSSKPSPNSSISGDTKTSSRTKSTPTPTGGGRSYSEEDLHSVLEEMPQRRSAQRKTATNYNIPRATLRNKKFDLCSDVRRIECQDPDMENDLSGEDEGDRSSNSTPQTQNTDEYLARSNENLLASGVAGLAAAPFGRTFQNTHAHNHLNSSSNNNNNINIHNNNHNNNDIGDENSNNTVSSPKPIALHNDGPQKSQCSTPSNLTMPLSQASPLYMDPNIAVLLQSLLLSTNTRHPELDKTVTLRELLNNVLLQVGRSVNDAMESQNHNLASHQVPPPTVDEVPAAVEENKSSNMMQHRLLLQQLQKQQQPFHNMMRKSETPDTSSSMDTLDNSDDPHSLIKIPSFKPVANSSNSSASISNTPASLLTHSINNDINRNGDSPGSGLSPQPSILAAAVSGTRPSNLTKPVMSPSLGSAQHSPSNNGDSKGSPSISLRDIITSSIQRTMNEQATKDPHAAASLLNMSNDSERFKSNGDYKKGTIYVSKNIGGTDTSSFGAAPNMLASSTSPHLAHHQHLLHAAHQHPHAHSHLHSRHHAEQLSRQEAAALAAGKGTRPKRGKYRNYDRSSLVEAVKAVQRGEMSVHRAGSFYGVPHSTLEYKVKERHLMRPRKREPKPQAGLDGGNSNSSTSKNNSNIPGHDKHKNGTSNGSSSKLSNALKSGSPAANATSLNGLKSMPLFSDSALAYSPFLWAGAPAFSSLQMDFNRNSGNATNEFMELYQKEALLAAGARSSGANSNCSPNASPLSNQTHQHSMHFKELTENIGDNVLGGIIRSTLNRNSADLLAGPGSGAGAGALLDQLLIKSGNLQFPNHRDRQNDYDSGSSNALKRSASPLSYNSDIKRERGSSDEDNDNDNDHDHDHDHDRDRDHDNDHDDDDDDEEDEDEETSRSALGNDETHEHNNNNNNNNNNNKNNNNHHHHNNNSSNNSKYLNDLHERSRLTSRDSETDGSSIKSEMYLNNNANLQINSVGLKALNELNGGKGSLNAYETGTSILQEKLAQIKAEQNENEGHL